MVRTKAPLRTFIVSNATKMRQFLKHLILLMAAVTAITAVLVLAGVKYVIPIDFCTIVYFSAICFISQYIVCRTLAKNPKKFPQAFMLVEFGKILLHIVVLAGYIWAHQGSPADARAFLVFFAAMFMIYLVFGTLEMHRLTKQ